MKSDAIKSERNPTHLEHKALRMICFSSQSDTHDLVLKAAHFRDIEVDLEFGQTLADFQSLSKPEPDIVIIEMRGTAQEQQFYRLLHEGELSECEIIVLCSGADAKEWHTLVMEREIADYMVVRPLYDPHRLRVQLRQSMERCSLRRLLQLAATTGTYAGSGTNENETQNSSSPFALFRSLVRQAQVRPDFLVDLFAVDDAVRKLQPKEAETNGNSEKAQNDIAKQTPSTILVVEDDLASAQVLSEILKSEGYKFIHAASFDDAIQVEGIRGTDLAVVDLMVPGTHGIDGIRLLQSAVGREDFPIIVSSANSESEMVEKLVGVGIRAFILKPVQRTTFISKIREVLAQSALNQTSQSVRG